MLIDRKDFERWAETTPAKAEMAELVTQLVMNTLPNDGSRYDIPIGSTIFCGGWDGIVESVSSHHYIPAGRSGWEFGARGDFSTKANDDYYKRTDEISDEEKLQMTFVFVTPYFWGNKDKWVEEKKKENKWKDVIVYDSDRLSQWIYQLPIVTEWFAKKVCLFSETGIVLPQKRWEEITIGPNGIVLTPHFYIAGRERLVDDLKDIVEGGPMLKAYRASSREEAMGFILAAGMMLPEPARSKFLGKTVVVDSKDSLRRMADSRNAINIVTYLEDNSYVYAAAAKNIVFVSLGPDDPFRQDVVNLPISEKHALIEELVSYQIPEPEAQKMVMTNSCNITLIRKDLGFPPDGVEWIEKENINELKPALLLSRWNENYESDTTILAAIWGEEYKKCQQALNHWLKLSVPPLTKTGSVWRLTSPLLLWSELSVKLDDAFFYALHDTFINVFVESKKKYSEQLREGLIQTLIIMALYGERLRIPIPDSQKWVDDHIRLLIHDAGPEKWVEFSNFLPLIAEASPDVFIEEVELAINKKTPVLSALFEEKDGFFSPQSHHTSLLWALEALAWHPLYLKPVTKILLQLTAMDPGGHLSNRPFNSLVDIYLPWRPHTSVDKETRFKILDECIENRAPCMWRLLIAMIPHPGSVTTGTCRLKWRNYEFSEVHYSTYKDIDDTTEWVVDRLMLIFSGKDSDMASLIDAMEPIHYPLRSKLTKWICTAVECIEGTGEETRKALRETLWYQNLDGIKSEFALSGEEMADIKWAYDKLEPKDLAAKYLWLFNEFYPHLPNKPERNRDDVYENSREVDKLRRDACQDLLENLGEDEVIALKDVVKEPQTLGSIMASFPERESIVAKVCQLLGSPKDLNFTRGYLRSLESLLGDKSLFKLFYTCKNQGFTTEALISFLLALEPTRSLWSFVEGQEREIGEGYWQRIPAFFGGKYQEDKILYMISRMTMVGRGLDAMNGAWIYADEMPTHTIQKLLLDVLKSNKKLNDSINHHPLSVFMEKLHHREDSDKGILLHLEWMYLPVMRYEHRKDNFKLLNEKMSKDAVFAVDVMSNLFKSDQEDESGEEVSDEERDNALRAFYLLNQWKAIPGLRDDNTLDVDLLSNWLHTVIEKAEQHGILGPVCSQIGRLLAYYPEWVEEAENLFAVMESIDNKTFYSGYNIGLFNKRGFTSRNPYEGGDIERKNSSMFRGLYDKYRTRYPRVAKVFKDLADQYDRMAVDMDNQADIAKMDY